MAENKIRDDNYFQVSGFMINRLGLKGVPLNVYAILYGFSQDGENEYTGGLSYLCEFAGNVSRPTVIKALKELTEKEYIIKREEIINNVKFTRYKINLQVVKNLYGGSKETLQGVVKNLYGGSKETLPNNKIYNKELYINNIDYQHIADLYNDTCVSFPRIISLSENRKKAIKARLNKYTIEQVKEVFEKAEKSDFLKGGNNRNWTANFDWLMKEANFEKVIEGNYNNRTKNKPPASYDLDEYTRRALQRPIKYTKRSELENNITENWETKKEPDTVANNEDIRAGQNNLKIC